MPAGGVTSLVPFVHVSNVAASVAFYGELGFKVAETFEHKGKMDWAFLYNGEAQLMLARSTEPIDPKAQAVLFYLYSPQLQDLREHLLAQGLKAGPIKDGSPGPSQEMRVDDPDGYCLMVAQQE